MLNRILGGLVQLIRRRPAILALAFRSALEITKEINQYLIEGKIDEARALVRKLDGNKAERLREVLADPGIRQHMTEKTIKFYEECILELESQPGGTEIA